MAKTLEVVTKDKLALFKEKIDQTYSKKTEIPKDVSQLNNDSNFITLEQVPEIDDVTSSKNGLMLSADKIKLDGISEGANKITKTSEIENNSGFITSKDIPSNISKFVNDSNYVTQSYVDSKISSTFKPSGSLTFASLPALSKDILGNVYNITNSFTTTADFLEGTGKPYPAGTNVVCVAAGSGSTYKWDVLAGMVDLSGYMLTTDIAEVSDADINGMFS